MELKSKGLVKFKILFMTFLIFNLIIFYDIDHCYGSSPSELTNEDLMPEVNYYWKYRQRNFQDNSHYEYNLTLKRYVTKTVANKDVKVMVLEGYGKIIKFPKTIVPSDDNEIYIKKEINTETMEVIKYTQYLDLKYLVEDKSQTRYIHENTTYDFKKLTKPETIIIGSNWTKDVKRRITGEIKNKTGDINIKPPHADKINSSVVCDTIKSVGVPAGIFNSFVIVEFQKVIAQIGEEVIDTKVHYYFSKDVYNYVKKERYDYEDNLEEIEELIKFGEIKVPNNSKNHENDNEKDELLIDLGDLNTRILLGGICIFIACIIFGYIGYKKYKK